MYAFIFVVLFGLLVATVSLFGIGLILPEYALKKIPWIRPTRTNVFLIYGLGSILLFTLIMVTAP